jgi:uncharacterized RDD family membrane protein YckC
MAQLSINTTQNVNISFTAAPVSDRLLASLADLLVKTAYYIVIYYVFFEGIGLNTKFNHMDGWSVAAICLLFYLPIMTYSLVQESIFEGQTLGKRLLRIKVVKIDGYQATFAEYLIRWFCRIIDTFIWTGGGVIALITVATSKKSQRIGDMAAGTAVISLKNKINISHTILEEIGEEYVPVYPLVIKLSDNDMRIIKETFHAAKARQDYVTVHKLKVKIETVTGIKNQSGPDEDFIRTILKDYNFYTRSM